MRHEIAVPSDIDAVDQNWQVLDDLENGRRIRSIAEIPSIQTFGMQTIRYLVDDVLPEGAVTALTGDAGSGKSTIAFGWARLAAGGGVATLVLDRENPIAVVRDRLHRLGMIDGPMLRLWGGWVSEEAPQPASPIVLDWVKSCDPPPLVIIDSLSAFYGGDQNDAGEMRAFMNQCRKLADLGATVLVIHHDGKAESAKDYRGSSDFKAAIDVGHHVSNFGDGGHLGRLVLRCFKSRFGFSGELVYHYASGKFVRDQSADAPSRTYTDELNELLRNHPGILKSKFESLAAEGDLGRNVARRFLDEGVVSGAIRVEAGTRKNMKHYFPVQAKPNGE